MADHFPGPRAIADPAADIADVYAFPSPEWPGRLVLVLNVFPGAAPTATFSAPVQGSGRAAQAGTCTTPSGQQVPLRVGEPAQARGLRIFAGARQNVLSIVAETDVAAVSGPGAGPLVAVVGETVTSGRHPVRLRLVGRPEIKNVKRDPDGEQQEAS